MTATQAIRRDFHAIFLRDPAARSKWTVLLTYSGFHALVLYRLAHFLYLHRYHWVAHLISRLAKFLTGVEIHPAAKIGYGVVIDHGVGVVIGETAEIGNHVLIYQGVTLGGTGKETGKRHPTVADGAIISAGAKILGPFTVGQNARIGAGSIVLREVPPGATVVGIPGRIVKIGNHRFAAPSASPATDSLQDLTVRIDALEKRLNTKFGKDR